MTGLHRSLVVAFVVFLVYGVFAAPQAQANPYPCRGLPGERIVGMYPGNQAQAPIAMCVRDQVGGGAAAPAPPPRPTMIDNYAAVAVSDFTTDVFAAWGMASFDAARDAAIERCRAFTNRQDGCYYMMGVRNGTIAVAMRDDGQLVSETGPDQASAERTAMAKCTQNARQCVIYRSFNAPPLRSGFRLFSSDGYSPPRNVDTTRKFASTAWPDQALPSPAIWVSSGHTTMQDADMAAVSRCAADTGMVCKPRVKVADTHLLVIRDGNQLVASSALGPEYASALMASACRSGTTVCAVIYQTSVQAQDTRKIELPAAQ